MKISNEPVRLIIIMGVSGTGKTTVGKVIAAQASYTFLDADDFHSEEAKLHMAQNKPLTDEMRAPWLAKIISHLSSLQQQGISVVLAYSGLKLAHRDMFRTLAYEHYFIYLKGSKAVIQARIQQRENHFFSPALLNSQFSALEQPQPQETDIFSIDIDRGFTEVVNDVTATLLALITEVKRD